MIKTLKGKNGSFAAMGSVQIQPQPVDSPEDQAQHVPNDPFSSGPVPMRQAALSIPVLLHTTGSVSHVQTPSLSELSKMLSTDPDFVFPLGSHSNQIVPTNNLSLDAGKTYDPRLNQDQVMSSEQFHQFELTTGISQERPEVIMMTGFSPLFEKRDGGVSGHVRALHAAGFHSQQTDAGRFVDAQFNMRSMQSHHAQSHVRGLRGRYPTVDKTVADRTRSFNEGLLRLRDDASFLLNAMRMLSDDKSRLDLRNDAFLLKDPAVIGRHISRNFDQLRSPSTVNRSVDIVELLMSLGSRKTFDFTDCMHDLGYSQASVRNEFSSTKIWMQTLYELREALKHHSLLLLDIDPMHQRRDNSPVNINKPPTKYFGIAETLPSLPSMSTIINLKVSESSQAISTIQAAFLSIYQNAFFKNDESRIAALAHTISREFRYSHGLSNKQVNDSLGRFYGYVVAPAGNLGLFDSVIGTFGNNISDFSDTSGQSLVSIAQSRPSSGVGVLTFETKQVERDNSTLLSGGDYFFDSVLAKATAKGFDVKNCEALASAADEQLNQLLVIVDGFNLLMIPSVPDPRRPGTSHDVNANFLEHPLDLTFELAGSLINPTSGLTLPPVAGDRLGAVYARALNDNKLKTMLFLYTMSKISRAYANNVAFFNSDKVSDNTPLTDHLVNAIVESLQQTVPETRSAVQMVTQRGLDKGLNTSSLTPASIRHSLKSGTTLTMIVERFMSSVIDRFRNKTSAINDGRTRYGGYLDTVVMMMAFDLAIAMVARYSSQQLVGAHHGLTGFSQGQVTFVVTQASTNHQASVDELVQRLNRESSLVRQLVVTIANALLVIGGMGRSTSNFFKTPQAMSKLTDLLSGLDGDIDMLRLLLTEQQAMLLASTIESLIEASSQHVSKRSLHGSRSMRHVAEHEIAVIDGSDVPPETQHALFSLFGSSEYASKHANNKKILTVGIPLGLLQRLRHRVNVRDQKRATFNDRRTDVIQVTVYKVDMQNVDIVFRPLRFLFEMSRFPVRHSASRWLELKDDAHVADVVSAVPTRNFDQGTASSRRSPVQFNVEYASTTIASQQGVKNAKAAFDDSSYSFLTHEQRVQILHNHVVSQLLEVYVRMMTGIDVSEESYHIVDPPSMVDTTISSQLVQHSLARLAENVALQGRAGSLKEPTGGVMFSSTSTHHIENPKKKAPGTVDNVASNPAGTAGNMGAEAQFKSNRDIGRKTTTLEQQSVIGAADASLDAMSHKHVTAVISTLRVVSRLSTTMSPLSLPSSWRRRVMVPKQFDRVFNVIIDPHDFDIDMKKTTATPYGKQALDLLVQHGEIVPSGPEIHLKQFGFKQWASMLDSSALRGQHTLSRPGETSGGTFRFRTRDKNAGDLVADKYFVTIETLDEGDDR